MQSINMKDSNFTKNLVFFLFLYASLIVSFIFNENSTGGALIDYSNQKTISEKFVLDFKETFFTYNLNATRHSPILIIFLSFLEKLSLNDYVVRLIHMHLSLFLPFVFFKLLKTNYKDHELEGLLLLTSLIFFSPTFRTLSIWPDSRIFGVIIFCCSIYFYLNFKKEKDFYSAILNIIFCALASYVSPNFAVFSIFYFYHFFLVYKKTPIKLFQIISLNLFLSLPAFYYIFVLDINFLINSAAVGINAKNIFFLNFYNNFLLISSIIFFYLLPFILVGVIKLNKVYNIKIYTITLALCLLSFYFFDYKYEYTGGGIFFKFSQLVFKNNFLFFIITFFSILIVLNLCNNKFENFLLLILIYASNPQITIYHKYYDPFLMIVFFTLFNFKIDIKKIHPAKNKTIIYLFFSLFLLISNLKHLWTN